MLKQQPKTPVLMKGPSMDTNELLDQMEDEFKIAEDDDAQILNDKHDRLIEVILAEEEEVTSLHRQHIDDMVELAKQVNLEDWSNILGNGTVK